MGILKDAWDFWTKPGLRDRLGGLFADNAPAGGDALTRRGDQIDRQTGGGGGGGGSSGGGSGSSGSSGEPREPRGRNAP